MGYPLICHPVLSDAATLAKIATTATSMPLSNLQVMQPTDRCRFTDLGETISFTVDLTDAMTTTGIAGWNFVALLYTNLDEDATWQVIAASSEAGLSSPPYDSTVVTFWPSPNLKPTWDRVHGWLYLGATPRTETWLQITIFNATNPATYLDIGRLYVSLAYQPALPREFGEMPDDFEEEKTIRAEGGPEYTRSDGPVTVFPLALQVEGETAKEELMLKLRRLKRQRGTSRDIFVIDDPDEADFAMEHCCYGRMTSPQATRVPGFERYEVSITVRELR